KNLIQYTRDSALVSKNSQAQIPLALLPSGTQARGWWILLALGNDLGILRVVLLIRSAAARAAQPDSEGKIMQDKTRGMRRRAFLKSGLLTAAGTAALGTGLVPAAEPAAEPAAKGGARVNGLPARPFGKTGLTLPVFGMGGSAMVLLSKFAGYGVELLPLEKRVAMVRYAYDQGVRYFDTARIYGESESVMGQGLKGLRDKVFLATKVHATDPDKVKQSLEESLKELGMSSVDLVLIHSPAIERVGFDGAMKLHAELVKLRDQKLFRYIGLTTHVAFETVYKMICTGGFDQVLLAYGYFRKGLDTLHSHRNLEWRDLCLAK